jgi:tRNA pseudouridine55 synthase
LLDWQSPLLTLRVKCSKGTYIRVLGEDIGAALNCGGHLQALRRTGAGSLKVENAISLDSFAAMEAADRLRALGPVDSLLSSFESIELDAALTARFRQGQRLPLQADSYKFPSCVARVRVYGPEREFLGSAHLQPHGVLAPERLVAAVQA